MQLSPISCHAGHDTKGLLPTATPPTDPAPMHMASGASYLIVSRESLGTAMQHSHGRRSGTSKRSGTISAHLADSELRNQLVILGMRSDPEPDDLTVIFIGEHAIVDA